MFFLYFNDKKVFIPKVYLFLKVVTFSCCKKDSFDIRNLLSDLCIILSPNMLFVLCFISDHSKSRCVFVSSRRQ